MPAFGARAPGRAPRRGALAERRDEAARRAGPAFGMASSMRSRPMAKPIAGSFGAAELLDHAVVAAAAEQGVLRAELARRGADLEQRARVVVEAAHQARGRPRTACRARQGALQALPVRAIVGFEQVEDGRRARDGLAIARILESRMRSGLSSRRFCACSLRFAFRLEVGDAARRGSARGCPAAERVHAHPRSSMPSAAEARRACRSSRRRAGPGVAVELAARLVKLAVAPALRLLGAEHRAEVVQAADRLLGVERVTT